MYCEIEDINNVNRPNIERQKNEQKHIWTMQYTKLWHINKGKKEKIGRTSGKINVDDKPFGKRLTRRSPRKCKQQHQQKQTNKR